MRRPEDWLRQAELDFRAADDARQAAHFEWACFAAQQAAEKAVKALHESQGTEAWGHAVAGLLEGLEDVPAEIREAGAALDKYYVPTRYPNAHPGGAPGDIYRSQDAELAIAEASKVLEHVRGRLSSA